MQLTLATLIWPLTNPLTAQLILILVDFLWKRREKELLRMIWIDRTKSGVNRGAGEKLGFRDAEKLSKDEKTNQLSHFDKKSKTNTKRNIMQLIRWLIKAACIHLFNCEPVDP